MSHSRASDTALAAIVTFFGLLIISLLSEEFEGFVLGGIAVGIVAYLLHFLLIKWTHGWRWQSPKKGDLVYLRSPMNGFAADDELCMHCNQTTETGLHRVIKVKPTLSHSTLLVQSVRSNVRYQVIYLSEKQDIVRIPAITSTSE